ncbi:MAG: Na+/H+ antiporter subunit E [Eisenbergiella massiliensis]
MSLKLRGNGFMYILFFLLWVLFNGQVTLEIVLFGIVIAGAVCAFCCKFLDYSPGKDWMILKKSGYILAYLGVLIWEIIKANAATQAIVSPHTRVHPVIVRFRADLRTRTARVLLANSITLTPGTITVALEDNEYTVHCLDRRFGEGLADSSFVRLLHKIEGQVAQ